MSLSKPKRRTKLSPTQERLLAAARAAGPSGLAQPETSNRASVRALSAWHRTAASLQERGLAKLRHNGSMYWLVAQ
ncbi:MAG: hypothetical protein EBS54_04755 [Betaproteobacteria bacterium]|nr:hypothetical protein [Betaproteobacteria bacterium]